MTIRCIKRNELLAKLKRGEQLILIDTLPAKFYEVGHLPGAINIPSDDILEQALQQLPDKNAEIVVYCSNGPCKRSGLSAERLKRLGYINVRDYHDGKEDWIKAGLSLEAVK